jgi:hypothetical protein
MYRSLRNARFHPPPPKCTHRSTHLRKGCFFTSRQGSVNCEKENIIIWIAEDEIRVINHVTEMQSLSFGSSATDVRLLSSAASP